MKPQKFTKHIFLILGFLTLILVYSCKSQKTDAERAEALDQLEQFITDRDFKIDINAAFPFNTNATREVLNNLMRFNGNTANRINVNGYDITFKNDSIQGYLPYYGEQQLSSGRYNTDLGIEFGGVPKDYELIRHKNKDALVMKFTINDDRDTIETYKVFITFFPSETADVNIVTSHRNGISYRGRVIALE
ncbi:DUF4251 domain-containing protein [Winogradskyella aquimaris]|uniref:DUF4251 domain-containing protein n=1 Tax=Winogradskyella aquimaris TaxID=864074 RepID=A0ABU5EJV9_9FLAO|nr:DUF4251 domain-containing protein [Winogradskyella aquimaris]MDY2586587.1 DUF4251 domain-containing protein [Winogradskyella aquimaris]